MRLLCIPCSTPYNSATFNLTCGTKNYDLIQVSFFRFSWAYFSWNGGGFLIFYFILFFFTIGQTVRTYWTPCLVLVSVSREIWWNSMSKVENIGFCPVNKKLQLTEFPLSSLVASLKMMLWGLLMHSWRLLLVLKMLLWRLKQWSYAPILNAPLTYSIEGKPSLKRKIISTNEKSTPDAAISSRSLFNSRFLQGLGGKESTWEIEILTWWQNFSVVLTEKQSTQVESLWGPHGFDGRIRTWGRVKIFHGKHAHTDIQVETIRKQFSWARYSWAVRYWKQL